MTDIELVKACADAMGLEVAMQLDQWRFPNTQSEYSLYNPLHDDAQAMALVKRFKIAIEDPYEKLWHADIWQNKPTPLNLSHGQSIDLNRAIVECVAALKARNPSTVATNK